MEAHVSWKPVVCEVLNPHTLLQRHIQLSPKSWTPLFLLVYPFTSALLLICCCLWDLLVRPLLLLILAHILPPPLPPWLWFILMDFFLFYAIFFWFFLWWKLTTPWYGESQLKQGSKIAVGTLNAPDVHKEWWEVLANLTVDFIFTNVESESPPIDTLLMSCLTRYCCSIISKVFLNSSTDHLVITSRRYVSA